MSKLMKLLLGLVVVGAIAIGGAVFYVTTKIKPEDIRKIAEKEIGKVLKNANVSIKKIDYSIGTSITLNVADMDIHLKKNLLKGKYDKGLFKVSDVDVKIPIWALLTNGGTISVKVKKPSISFNEFSKTKNNVTLALGETKAAPKKIEPKKKDGAPESKAATKIELPAFINNSKINVSFTDININYSLFNSIKGNTVFSRVLLKNINFKTPTAYEIASNIKVNLDPKTEAKTSLLVIGDFDIKKFLEDGKMETNVVVTLSKTSMTGLPISVPTIKTQAKATMVKSGDITATVKVNIGSVIGMNLSAFLGKTRIKAQGISVAVNLENAVGLMPEMKDSLKDINLNKSSLFLKGDVELVSATNQLNPNLTFGLTKPVSMKLVDGITAVNSMNGSYAGKKVNVKTKTQLAGGEIATTIKTTLDPLNQKFDPANLAPIFVSVIGGNMKITKEFIQKTLYGKKAGSTKTAQAKEGAEKSLKKSTPATKIILPQTKTTIDLRQIYVDKSEATINGDIHTKGNKAYSKNLKFSFSKGRGNINFNTKLLNSANIDSNFKFGMKNLDFSGFNAFLPKMLTGVTGVFNGNADGLVQLMPNKLAYNVNANVDASNAKVYGLNLKEKMKTVYEKMRLDPKKLPPPDHFRKLSFKGNLTTKAIKIAKANFWGPTNTVDFSNIKGSISMNGGPSKADLNTVWNYHAQKKDLIKRIGTNSIPLHFKGNGFGLKPDVGKLGSFLLKKAGKVAANKAKKKVKAKAKKKLKKATDKLKNKLKNKFKNLFR